MMGAITSSLTNGATITSPQMGNITMNPQMGRMRESHNDSEDINTWDPTEFRNFVKWFIEVHHPEAVKQYQAIRAIERMAEEAERLEYEAQQAEYMKQFWANQARGAQNAYPYNITSPQQGYGIAVQVEPPPQQGFFENLKRFFK